MAIVRRTNCFRNSTFANGDLSLWSVVGSATQAPVFVSGSYRNRITFPASAAIGAAGTQQTVTGLTAGTSYRLWMSVPNKSGSTTVQIVVSGIATGAAFATNDPLFKTGTVSFTATGTTATIQLVNAVISTAADWVDFDYGIVEETNAALTTYPYFDGSFPGAYFAGPANMAASVWDYYDTTVPTAPMVITEFDARPINTYDFVLDRDALDDPNVALIDSPRWYAVPDTEHIQIRRGRQDIDSDIGAGTATITIRDYDGVFDPDNPSTPLQINGVPVMRAGMRIRVSAVGYNLGTLVWSPLFVGSLDDVEIDRTYEPTTTVYAVDDLAKLSTSEIPSFDPPINSGWITLYRVIWALGFAGIGFWDNTFGSNLQRQMLATAGGGTVLSELQKTANCEGGRVFAAADGRIHVGTHSDDFATNPAAVFTDTVTAATDIEYDDIKTSTSIRTMINRCVVDRGDQAAQVVEQDDDSVARNQRVWSETVEAPLYNDFDATALATWRATRRSRSATRVNSLTANMTGQAAPSIQAANLDISSVIRVKRYAFNRGIDDLYGIEGIDHDITVGTGWKFTVYTSALDITGLYADQPHPFILDTSALDSTDILSAF